MKLLTWNIRYDKAKRSNWVERKKILISTINRINPDLLCVQEGLSQQIESLLELLPNYDAAGIAAEEKTNAGREYCATFFRKRFSLLGQGSFRLNPAPRGWEYGYDNLYRVASWVKLEEGSSGAFFLVNTHLPYHPISRARYRAATALAGALQAIQAEPILLAGDFNSFHGSRIWNIFLQVGLRTLHPHRNTYHVWGIPVAPYDAILGNDSWRAKGFTIIKDRAKKPGFPGQFRYPSDHFGLCLELEPISKPA